MIKAYSSITAAMLPLILMTHAGPAWAEPEGAAAPADLAQALRATGWQVEKLGDGGLEVRLARTPPEAPTTAPPPQLAEAAAWDRLRAKGWRVERPEDGSLLLFPPPPETAPPSAPVGPPPPAAPRATERVEPSPGPKTGGLSAGIERLLRKRGWQADRQGDGSLRVYPLGQIPK